MVEILYSDKHMVVCLKRPGESSQDSGEGSVPDLLRKQFAGKAIYPIHRLDQAVGGVMVYALTRKAAAELSRQVQERKLDKAYFAILCAEPEQPEAELSDLLFHDRFKNKTYVVNRVRKGVKEAKLYYRRIAQAEGRTLVGVRLHTGRTHQIRVQFASRKTPLVGDRRYGGSKTAEPLALWSCALRLHHPQSGEPMHFFRAPSAEGVWALFAAQLHEESDILNGVKEL